MRSPVSTALLGGSALACLAAVGAALVSQHVFGMQPCPYCVLQRAIFIAIALGLPARRCRGPRRSGAALGALRRACCSRLPGIAAALWQHFVAAATASCNLTLADRIVDRAASSTACVPDVFSARASCADAAVDLLGVPYEFWSLALFVVIAWRWPRAGRPLPERAQSRRELTAGANLSRPRPDRRAQPGSP